MPPRFLQIGRIRKEISLAKATADARYVPELSEALIREHFPRPNTQAGQTVLQHLQWLMQKDILNQDMFLIGSPGPFRRRLVKYYCQLAHREVETLVITADTSEGDLKERREVSGNSVYYSDQAPLRAALHGRMLLLEDVHKAERNVLPTLNNLLENREMNLPSGRRLVHANSAAAKGHNNATPHEGSCTTLACSEHFRIVALGCPVPLFPGYTLDPPFRSRFQGRLVDDPTASSMAALEALVSIGGLDDNAKHLIHALPWAPSPQTLADGNDGAVATEAAEVTEAPSVARHAAQCYCPYTAAYAVSRKLRTATTVASQAAALVSSFPAASLLAQQQAMLSPALQQLLATNPPTVGVRAAAAKLMDSVAGQHSVCVIGQRGCGKTATVVKTLSSTGKRYTVFHCFKDMGVGDLLERRILDKSGNSSWQRSPIVDAAINGWCVVIDGLHRAPPGVLGALCGLIHDKTITLPSGLQLKPRRDGQDLSTAPNSVSPDFFVVGVAEENSLDFPWMTTETLSLFDDFVEIKAPPIADILEEHRAARLFKRGEEYANFSELLVAINKHIPLSARTIRLLVERIALGSCQGQSEALQRSMVRDLLSRSLLVPFLPATVKLSVEAELSRYHSASTTDVGTNLSIVVDSTRRVVQVGELEIAQGCIDEVDERLVPYAPNFVPIPSHARILHGIVEELLAASPSNAADTAKPKRHFLLIGNQGTGKNKLCDALLALLWREREYMQLNRDTTVQSLTMTPSVEGGKMKWDLSPLLVGVQLGRCVLVDEADKAPLEAVCVLKALLWDQFLSLPDGRIVRRRLPEDGEGAVDGVIFIHPDFRCFVLANRPGFPFLGNDFFRECGDIFSTFVVENPDLASELQLVRAYAPDVSPHILTQLCVAFEKLRKLVDMGELQYPFSTREIINISKHLNAFPGEPVSAALRNAMDFDAFTPHVQQLVKAQLEESGLVLHEGTVALTPVEDLSTEPSDVLPFYVRGDATALARLWATSDSRFSLSVRDVSNEVAHDMRPAELKRFTSPRSYQFTRLASEFQLASFAAAAAAASVQSANKVIRSVEQVVPLRTTDTGAEVLLVLARAPQGMFVVPVRPLFPDNSATQHTAAATTGATIKEEGSEAFNPREVDLSFASGAIHTILQAEPNVAVLVSLESAAVWFLTIAEKRGANELLQVAIPAAFYTGASPTVAHLINGATANPQKLGHKYMQPEAFVAVSHTRGDGATTLVLRNTAIGLGLSLQWSQRGDAPGTVSAWKPTVSAQFFSAPPSSEVAGGAAVATLQPRLTVVKTSSHVACMAVTEHQQVAPLLDFLPRMLPLPTSTTPDETPAVPQRKTVANLVQSSKQKAKRTAAAQPAPVTVRHGIDPPVLQILRSVKHQSTVDVDGECAVWLRISDDRRSVEIRMANGLSAEGASTEQREVPSACARAPVSKPQSESVRSASILEFNASARTMTVSVVLDEALALGGPHLAREEIWCLRWTWHNGENGEEARTVDSRPLRLALSRVRLIRDANQVPLADGNTVVVHTAVFASQPWSIGAGTRPLIAVSSDGVFERWDAEEADAQTSLKAWEDQTGNASSTSSTTQQELIVETLSDEQLEAAVASGLDGSLGFGKPTAPLQHEEGTQTPVEPPTGTGDGQAGQNPSRGNGSGASGSGGGGGGGSGSGGNLRADGKGGYAIDANGVVATASSRRRQTKAKVVLTTSTGSGLYDKCLQSVHGEIARVTSILEAAEVREKERVWQAHRLHGELDDRKLVDAIVGDANVYKKRGAPSTPAGLPQRKPKYIDVLVDVSASMARFNEWDGRLTRLCEAVVMLLESAKLFPNKFVVDVHGHSGSSARTPFLRCSSAAADLYDAPTNVFTSTLKVHKAPENVPGSLHKLADRVRVVEAMAAHARSTTSGDGTIDALRLAVEHCKLVSHEMDECFVILVSDANLGGYGVTPKEIRDLIPDVPASAATANSGGGSFEAPIHTNLVFLSEKEAADYLCNALPAGVGRHCPFSKDIPQILRDIFLNAAV